MGSALASTIAATVFVTKSAMPESEMDIIENALAADNDSLGAFQILGPQRRSGLKVRRIPTSTSTTIAITAAQNGEL